MGVIQFSELERDPCRFLALVLLLLLLILLAVLVFVVVAVAAAVGVVVAVAVVGAVCVVGTAALLRLLLLNTLYTYNCCWQGYPSTWFFLCKTLCCQKSCNDCQ